MSQKHSVKTMRLFNRLVSALVIAPAILAGCSGDGEAVDMKTDPSTVMNPGGKEESLPPQAQGMAAKQQAAGDAASRNMNEAARQMAAAKAASGAK